MVIYIFLKMPKQQEVSIYIFNLPNREEALIKFLQSLNDVTILNIV